MTKYKIKCIKLNIKLNVYMYKCIKLNIYVYKIKCIYV